MFPSLAARETYVAEPNFASWKQGNVLNQVANIFASKTQNLLPQLMFPSLPTQGNMFGNSVSATMFPSLARPL